MARAPRSQHYGAETPARIRRLLPGENVYARLLGFDIDMGRIGAITVGWNQASPHMIDIGVLTDVSLGAVRLTIGDRRYEWSLSGVYIRLDIDNADIIPGSYYRDVWQEGGVESAARNEQSQSTTGEIAGEAKAEVEAGYKRIPFFRAVGRTRASATGKKQRESKDTSHANISPMIVMVEPQGQGFRAQDGSQGKLRATHDLRGEIVRSYRRRPADGKTPRDPLDDQTPTPLVRLRARDQTKPVAGRISVRVEREDFVIDGDKDNSAEMDLIERALGEDRSAWLKRRSAAESELRSRVAGLAAAPKPGEPGEREFDLFSCAFCVEPEGEE